MSLVKTTDLSERDLKLLESGLDRLIKKRTTPVRCPNCDSEITSIEDVAFSSFRAVEESERLEDDYQCALVCKDCLSGPPSLQFAERIELLVKENPGRYSLTDAEPIEIFRGKFENLLHKLEDVRDELAPLFNKMSGLFGDIQSLIAENNDRVPLDMKDRLVKIFEVGEKLGVLRRANQETPVERSKRFSRTMTAEKAARYLGVSAALLQKDRVSKSPEIPCVKIQGRYVYYKDRLDAYIESRSFGG